LKESNIRERFTKIVGELVNLDLWICGNPSRMVLTACDELCEKMLVRRDRGNTWWWNEGVKDALARKKKADKELCNIGSKENKLKYKKTRNETKKAVATAMRRET